MSLLMIDPEPFAENFDRHPFYIAHSLGEHALFDLRELAALSGRLRPRLVEWNDGHGDAYGKSDETRAALFVIFYAFVGTIIAMVGYRILWGGHLSTRADAPTIDGIITFISIMLYTALAFAAGGVAAAWLYPTRRSVVLAALAAAAVAAGVASLMMPWYRGLSIEFPIIVGFSAIVCSGLAWVLRLFRIAETRR